MIPASSPSTPASEQWAGPPAACASVLQSPRLLFFVSSAGIAGLSLSSQGAAGIRGLSLQLGLAYLCHVLGSAAGPECPHMPEWLLR